MDDQWFYAINGKQLGPVSFALLQQAVSSGHLKPNDLVWAPGMALWTAASTVEGLVPVHSLEPQPIDMAPLDVPERPLERRPPGEDPWYERDHPRRYRPPQGMSTGAKVGIGVGIAAAVLLLIGGVVAIVILSKPGNPRSFSIRRGEAVTYHITFKAGTKAEIWVTSDHDSDIDIFIYDANGAPVTRDEGDSKNCYVTWNPSSTQSYKVEVQNRVRLEPHLQFRNRDNYCTLKYSPP